MDRYTKCLDCGKILIGNSIENTQKEADRHIAVSGHNRFGPFKKVQS